MIMSCCLWPMHIRLLSLAMHSYRHAYKEIACANDWLCSTIVDMVNLWHSFRVQILGAILLPGGAILLPGGGRFALTPGCTLAHIQRASAPHFISTHAEQSLMI